jgi:hypothetical protein
LSYFVVCTFDLKNGSYNDYVNAYADLAALGLQKAVVSEQGHRIVAPTTTTVGTFDGQSAESIRNGVRDSVKAAFARRGFTSEIFVVASGDWAWGAATTQGAGARRVS